MATSAPATMPRPMTPPASAVSSSRLIASAVGDQRAQHGLAADHDVRRAAGVGELDVPGPDRERGHQGRRRQRGDAAEALRSGTCTSRPGPAPTPARTPRPRRPRAVTHRTIPSRSAPMTPNSTTAAAMIWHAISTADAGKTTALARAGRERDEQRDAQRARDDRHGGGRVEPLARPRALRIATAGSASTTIGATIVTGASASARICSTAHAVSTATPSSHAPVVHEPADRAQPEARSPGTCCGRPGAATARRPHCTARRARRTRWRAAVIRRPRLSLAPGARGRS